MSVNVDRGRRGGASACALRRPRFRGFVMLVRCLIASSCLIYDGDFFDRKLRGDLGTFFRDDHHFFRPHAPLKRLAVLRFRAKLIPG